MECPSGSVTQGRESVRSSDRPQVRDGEVLLGKSVVSRLTYIYKNVLQGPVGVGGIGGQGNSISFNRKFGKESPSKL